MSHGKESILAIEVGGTNTQIAVVDKNIQIASDVYAIPSQEQASEEEHIHQFASLIQRGLAMASQADHTIAATCLAFPGRSDYDAGVPLIRHKYATLYNRPFTRLLEATTGLPVFMLNDAGAFASGAAYTDQELIAKIEQLPAEARWFTAHSLGTGLGSKVVDLRDGVVVNEFEIFDFPYEGGELEEDYISARGIVKAYRRITGTDQPITPEDIARLAYNGDDAAAATYVEFGNHLGHGLPQAYRGLRPELIAVGGKISRSISLFGDIAIEAYRRATNLKRARLHRVMDERVALYGAAIHAFGRLAIETP